MAEESLFPVFDIEDIVEEDSEKEEYLPSVSFDYELGDFVRDGANRMVLASGKEAYAQWCMKVIDTEREEHAAYSDDIGTEFEEIIDTGDRLKKESEIRSTITDALMVHPATEYVRNFVFEHQPDACLVTFTVKGRGWTEQELMVAIPE